MTKNIIPSTNSGSVQGCHINGDQLVGALNSVRRENAEVSIVLTREGLYVQGESSEEKITGFIEIYQESSTEILFMGEVKGLMSVLRQLRECTNLTVQGEDLYFSRGDVLLYKTKIQEKKVNILKSRAKNCLVDVRDFTYAVSEIDDYWAKIHIEKGKLLIGNKLLDCRESGRDGRINVVQSLLLRALHNTHNSSKTLSLEIAGNNLILVYPDENVEHEWTYQLKGEYGNKKDN